MIKRISLKDNISPHFIKMMSFKGIVHYILSGGRGSTKTSFAALILAFRILQPKKASAICMRKHHNKIENSVFREVKRAFSRLGVSNKHLKIKRRPYSITYVPNGNTIYFSGLDDIDDIKGFIDEDRPIETVWLEELTQFLNEEEIYNIRATFNRNTTNFLMLYTYNNPSDNYHWIYDWLEKESKRSDVLYNSSTYLSVPPEFLGGMDGDFYKEANALKDIDFDQYAHTFLNRRIRLGGLIYKKFDEKLIVKPYKWRKVNKNIIGIDVGFTDATTFTFTQIINDFKKIRVRRHYYHKNDVTSVVNGLDYIPTGNDKIVDDYVEDFILFAQECFSLCETVIFVKVDSANKYFWKTLQKVCQQRGIHYLRIDKVNKVKKDDNNDLTAIEERITLENIMIGAGTLEIENHPSNYDLIKAFSQARRNDKGHRRDDGTTNIDSLDSFEYSWVEEYNILYNTMIREYSLRKDKKVISYDVELDKTSNVYIVAGKSYGGV